jgi:RNA polymerase sporulation-specific sigma factor
VKVVVNSRPKSVEAISDEDLAQLAQSGDRNAERVLLDRYEYLAHVKARSYFLTGAEHKDTVQEGMVGLYKAIRDFKEEPECSFRSFAILCTTRQIITAVKTYARKKHSPLSMYQSFDAEVPDEDILDSLSFENNNNNDPLHMFIIKEELDMIVTVLHNKLSEMEWNVFVEYLEDKSYDEIAHEIDCEVKVVDNALCRIKQKVQRYLDSPGCLEQEFGKLREKEVKKMAGRFNGHTLFIRTVCGEGKSLDQARKWWKALSQDEKDKWNTAATDGTAVPLLSIPEMKVEPAPEPVKQEPEPEPIAEPEPTEETGIQPEPEPVAIPPLLLSIIEQRPRLLGKVTALVVEELEQEKQSIEKSIQLLAAKLEEVQEKIESLQ